MMKQTKCQTPLVLSHDVGMVLTHFALEINGMSIAAHLLFSISANLILAHHNFYIKLCFLCIRDEDHKGNCSITNMKYGT